MLTAMGDVLREAHARGWITTRDGNISLRRGNKFYITPSAGRKTIIHPEHMIKFTIAADSELLSPDSNVKPSIELDMHWNIQKLGKSKAVVHLHPTYTVAAMYAGFDLKKIAADFPELRRYTSVGGTVPFVEPGSESLAKCVFNEMVDYGNKLKYDIVGMDRHGVCAVGANPWDAFEHIERLEHICQIVLASGVRPDAKD